METWAGHIGFIVTLIAVLDPFMAVPFFLGMYAARPDAERRRIARVASLTVMAILVGAALSGEVLLQFLGTSLSSFRIAGGLVLLLMSLAMLQAKSGNLGRTIEEANDANPHEEPGIVPLAIPLLAGPGAISTVMIAVQHGGWQQQVAVIADIVLVCLVVWAMLRLAMPIGRLLGPGGFNVATRLLGLLLAAIAVESMAVGLRELFPTLAGGWLMQRPRPRLPVEMLLRPDATACDMTCLYPATREHGPQDLPRIVTRGVDLLVIGPCLEAAP